MRAYIELLKFQHFRTRLILPCGALIKNVFDAVRLTLNLKSNITLYRKVSMLTYQPFYKSLHECCKYMYTSII